MKKRVMIILAVLLTVLFAVSSAAYYDEDDYAPRRRRGYGGWRSRMLTRTLSINVGLWRAIEANVEQGEGSIKFDDPDYLFSIGAKLWFWRSNWGVGIDAVLLDSKKFSLAEEYEYWNGTSWVTETTGYTTEFSMNKWLIDLDLYYRLPITRGFQAIGGVGLTFIKYVYDGAPGDYDDSMNVGYNLKAGGEIFIDRNWSVSAMFTWHHFNEGAAVSDSWGGDVEQNTVKMFSATAQINLYL